MDKGQDGALPTARATHEQSQQAVSAVPVGIANAAHRDAVTMFVGSCRQLWRSVMVENHCTQTRCFDIHGENCVCFPAFSALASSAFNVPDMVINEAQAMAARSGETSGSTVGNSAVGNADAPEHNQEQH